MIAAVGLVLTASSRLEPTKPVVDLPVIPPDYRRMADAEVTTELGDAAPSFLSLPYGAVVPVPNTDNLDVLAAIEQHFHPVGGLLKPWGWHKGVSLFIRQA